MYMAAVLCFLHLLYTKITYSKISRESFKMLRALKTQIFYLSRHCKRLCTLKDCKSMSI